MQTQGQSDANQAMDAGEHPKAKLRLRRSCRLCGAALSGEETDLCQKCSGERPVAEAGQATEAAAQGVTAEPVSAPKKAKGRKKKSGASVSILTAPFRGVVFLEALAMLTPILLVLLPVLIVPESFMRFLMSDAKRTGFLLKYLVWGITSFVMMCRCAALASHFECGVGFERNRIQVWLIGMVFLVLIVLTETPLRLAFRAVPPSHFQAMMADLKAIPMAAVSNEGAGWWGAFTAVNFQTCIQTWAVLSNLPWFVHVALAWYLIYRPFAVAMAGAWEEMDPTEVIRAMARCILPYIGVLVTAFVYGLVIWEIVLAITLAAGPALTSLEIGPMAGVRIGGGIMLLFAYFYCYTYAIKYPMLGCMLAKYMGVSEVEVEQKKLTRVEKHDRVERKS